jgi:hypothetical protein
MLASLRELVGAYDVAAAAWFALEHGVDVLTRHAERYAEVAKGQIALPFGG